MQDQTPGKGYGLGRVAFKSFSQEIRMDVEAGYPLTTIFAKYEDRLGITYSQFRRHVNRYILNQTPKSKTHKESLGEEASFATKPDAPKLERTISSFPKNFEFNPVASEEDLI